MGNILKGKKKIFGRIGATAVSVMLVAALVIGLMPNELAQVKAAYSSDAYTLDRFEDALGGEMSTQYAGRVWTDKTVWDESVTIDEATITKDVEKGEDFLVGFSALATTQQITGKTKAPLDVVFVVDLSGSMSNNSSNMASQGQTRKSRISYTVDALNESIQTLMDMNENTRVAVLGFETDTQVLLPLDHYERTDASTQFFRLSSTTPASGTSQSSAPTLYVSAKNSSGQTVNRIEGSNGLKVYGGTNLQMGLYEGMNLLAAENETTVEVNGQKLQRYPAVVVLSDGQPTYASSSSSWWSPNDDEQGPGSGSYYGIGMLAMMTGAYMKQAIDRNYELTGSGYQTTLYTIGVGTDSLSGDDGELARVTLNPKENYSDTNNDMAGDIRKAWETYVAGDEPDIEVDEGGWYDSGEYTLGHPTSNDIIPEDDSIENNPLRNYVDEYYSVSQGNEVAEAFQNIVSNISLAAIEIPTRYDASDPFNSGFITYTDPIGEYMEVKNMKSILFADEEYTYDPNAQNAYKKEGSDTSYTETYVFSGNVESAVYGKHDLNSIQIVVATEVAANGIKTQTMTIKVPAGMIPMRINMIELDTEGEVTKHTHNDAHPLHVIYSVGLQGVLNGDGYVKSDLISAEYKAANMKDGNINFYSNLYTGENVVNNQKAGNATVEFQAALTNPFYYIQEEQLIYTDVDCTIPASAEQELDDNTTYYYPETYYNGNEIVTTAVVRTGARLKQNVDLIRHDIGDGSGNQGWYRPAGTVRTNRMLEFEGTKDANTTGTAETFYSPSYVRNANATSDADGRFIVYLGNNGKMNAVSSGVLHITKTVTADEGLTAPDKDFTFKVDLTNGGNELEGTFPYTVLENGDVVGDGTISAGGTLTLKAGQTASVVDLPPGTTYVVTETNIPAGFTSEQIQVNKATVTEATGTLDAGETSAVAFHNHYSVESVTFPIDGPLQAIKTLRGRYANPETDTFAFRLMPADASYPMPTGYNDTTGVVVTLNPSDEHKEDNPYSQTFNFGQIKFTEPGVYTYSVVEKEPTSALPGMTYSRAQFDVVVTVTDNGEGKLILDSTTYQTASNNGGAMSQEVEQIEFTNTYSAEDVIGIPVAIKSYTDNSGGQKPLTNNMFQFKFEPVGYLKDGDVVETGVENVPMITDNGEKDGNRLSSVTLGNVNTAVTFGNIYYKQSDLKGQDSITFVYKFTEVIPSGASEGNNWTLNGMTYDPTVYYSFATVSKDANSSELTLNRAYYKVGANGELTAIDSVPTFKNEYNVTPVTLKGETALKAEKLLTGREWKDSDAFHFVLAAGDSATRNAIQSGNVIVAGDEYEEVISKDDANVSGEAVTYTEDFSNVTFKMAGTYKFTITETKGDIPGVAYDNTVYNVTVTVTDNNGTLEAAVVYNDGTGNQSHAIFENVYTAKATTGVNVSGHKTLEGKEIEAGTYWFETALQGEKAIPSRVAAAADGTIPFISNEIYKKAGTYVYAVKESIPDGAVGNVYKGVTYDTTMYRITVTVTDDTVGQLHAAVQIEKSTDGGTSYSVVEGSVDEAIQFTNTYKAAPVSPIIRPAKKEISGYRNEPLKENEFSFNVSVEGNPTDGWTFGAYTEGQKLNQDTKTVKNAADGTIEPIHSTNAVTFIKPGTYKISMKEVIPEGANKDNNWTLNGMTYDTHVVTTTYEVVDEGEGKLVAYNRGTSGATTFTNEYHSEGTQILTVTKSFVDKEDEPMQWREVDKYAFELTPYDGVTKAEYGQSITVKDDKTTAKITWQTGDSKTASFGEITFTKPGTYQFSLREVKPANEDVIRGVTYDVTPRIVTINVTDNGNGTMTASVDSITKASPEGTIEADLTFKNVYDVERDPLDGYKNLQITKNLVGREWLDTDAFTFNIVGYGEKTITAIDNEEVIFEGATEVVVTKEHKDDKTAHFGNILFKKPGEAQNQYVGEYKFVITEKLPSGANKSNNYTVNGITYDNTARMLTVEVTYEVLNEGTVNETHYLWAMPKKVETGTYEDGVFTSTDELDVFTDEGAVVDGLFTFTNTYDAENVTLDGETNLKVKKTLTGRNWRDSDSFTFNLIPAEDYGDAVKMPTSTTVNVTSKTKEAAFGDITFKKVGVYEFVISEVDDSDDRISCDTPDVTVTVTVTDNNEGKLVTEVEYSDDNAELEFVNTYTPEPVKVTLQAQKTLDGRAWVASDNFRFYISGRSTGAPIMSNVNAYAKGSEAVDGVAPITFDEITYTTPGTYTYYINEAGTYPAFTRDTRGLTAVVTVKNNEDTGKLEATVKYIFDGDPLDQGKLATFTNIYHMTGKLDGARNLEVTKDFIGRADDAWGDTDAFSFTLTPYGEATENAVNSKIVTLPSNASGITIKASDKEEGFKKAFGDITFTQPGTYYFEVGERIPTGAVVKDGETVKDGIAYDTATRIVKVTATDNYDGTLKVVAVVEGDNTLIFKNTYLAEPGSLNGAANLMVKKTLEGRDWITGDEFTFTLAAKDEFTQDAVRDEIVTLPQNADGITITKDDTGYQEAFGDIIFTKIGTYQFVITETNVKNGAESGNITKNTEPVTVTVDVSDNHTGNLVAAVTEYSSSKAGLTFKNTFTPEPISVDMRGSKKLLEPNGDALEIEAGRFTFKVQRPQNAPKGTPDVNASGNTVTNAAGKNAAVVFNDVVTFAEAGTYVYEIVEVQGSDAGVTYDTTTIKATVIVAYDKTTGKLSVESVKYGDEAAQDTFAFTNTYISKPTKFSFEGTKNVTVKNGKYKLDANQFEFKIEPTPGLANDPITTTTYVKNLADATPTDTNHQASIKLFDNVEYTQPGEYVYTITEVDGKYAGFSYDSAIYQLTVKVAYDHGQLKATPSVTKNQNKADAIVFNNTYDVDKAKVAIKGTKVLVSDDNKPLEDGKYTFTLTAQDPRNPMPELATVTNTGSAFSFGDITFTADDVGTYQYTVKETKGDEAGVTYDSTEYTVTIKVELQNVGGKKNAVVVTKDKDADDVVFTNKYVPHEVVVGPNATASVGGEKNLEGRELKANEFEFKLVPADVANPMPTNDTVKNAADGSFVFGDITYTQTGTYKYTMEEVNGGLGGVEYDDSVYGVVVDVTDEGFDGQLDAKVTYTLGSDPDVDVVFNNIYSAKAADLYLEGMKKSLKHADLKEGAFKFELTPADDKNPMPEKSIVTNGAHGDSAYISFGKITFTKAGIYEYTLTELNDEQEYMVYDETEHMVKIEVTDDLEGQLVARVIEPSTDGKLEDIVFNNSYEVPAIEFVKVQLINGKQVDENAVVKAGDEVTYVMTIKNVGMGTATGLQIMDKVPQGMEFIKNSVEGGDRYEIAEDGLTTWTVDVLAPGESRSMSFKATVPNTDKSVKWQNVASMIYENNPDNPKPTPEDPEPEPIPVPSNEVEVEVEIKEAPKMGDDAGALIWTGVAFASFALGAAVVILRKREEKTK